MKVEKVSFEEWNKISTPAHLVAFGETRPASMNTFDFAVVCFDEKQIFAYATVIEMNKESAYMQHGGSMPGVKGTTGSYRCWENVLDLLRRDYLRITMRVKNTNLPMLKFGMKQGFLIHGIDHWPNECYVHMKWEREC